MDAWVLDRVELIGGPSSFLHGAGAVGGSINYITKLASRDQQTIDGRIRYGSFDDSEVAFGINQALASNPADARHFMRLDFSRGHGNGYVDRNERDTDSLAFSLLSDLAPNLTHTLAVEYQEDREQSPYWGSPILPGRSTMKIDNSRRFENYNVADGRYEQRVRWLRSILDYQISDSTSVQNTLYHYNAQRDYRNLERYAYTRDGKVQRSSPYLQRHDQNLLGDRIELRHDNQLLGLTSQWSLGLEYSRMRQTLYPTSGSWSDVVDADHFNPGSFDDIPGVNAGLTKQRHHEVINRAVFAENRLQLTERLALLTALRYDYLDMEVTNYGAVSPTSPAYFERRWEPLSGRIGLTYALTPSASLYAQYSTSADLPPARWRQRPIPTSGCSTCPRASSGKWAASSTSSMVAVRPRWRCTRSCARTLPCAIRTTQTSRSRPGSRPHVVSNCPGAAGNAETAGRGQLCLCRCAVR